MFNKSDTIGNQTELMFDVIAQSNGWFVGYPYDCKLPYDRVISFGDTRSWHRVQIKTAYTTTKGYSYKCDVCSKKNNKSYTETCDYMAILANTNFYMFNVNNIDSDIKKFVFRLNDHKDKFIGGLVINHE
jgi:hypothetical protein